MPSRQEVTAGRVFLLSKRQNFRMGFFVNYNKFPKEKKELANGRSIYYNPGKEDF